MNKIFNKINEPVLLLAVVSLIAVSACKKADKASDTSTIMAAFTANLTTITAGETVSFKDQSTGKITAYNWTFEGGTPATSTDRDPKVTYQTAGAYKVTLVVSNGTNTDQAIKSGYIKVSAEGFMTGIAKITPKYNQYEAWPVVIETSSGAYLLSYTSNISHKPSLPSDRKTIIRRSVDHGQTWTQVALLGGPTGEDWLSTIMGVAADGAIVLGIQQVKDKVHGDAANHIFFRSTDDGLTWTEVARYPWTNISNIQKVTLLNNGDLLATWHGDGWGMIRSTDDGLTWSQYSTTNGGKWLSEGHMIQLYDGTILDFGRAGNIILGISTDNGRTFARAAETGLGTKGTTDGNTNNSTPTAVLLNEHKLLLLWIDREMGKMLAATADPYTLKTNPIAWSSVITIADVKGGIGDKGYPYMISKPYNGRLFTAWYEDVSNDHSPSIYTGWLSLDPFISE